MLWTIAIPWDSPGKDTRVGCCALLQWIFPNQGSNLHLLHLPALAGGFFTTSATWEAQCISLLDFTPALGAQNHCSAPTLGSVCLFPKHTHFHHQTEVSLPTGNDTSFLWIPLHTSVSIQTGWWGGNLRRFPSTFPLQRVSKILIYERSNRPFFFFFFKNPWTSRSGYVDSVEQNFWCGYSFESVFCLSLLSGEDSTFGAQEVRDFSGD